MLIDAFGKIGLRVLDDLARGVLSVGTLAAENSVCFGAQIRGNAGQRANESAVPARLRRFDLAVEPALDEVEELTIPRRLVRVDAVHLHQLLRAVEGARFLGPVENAVHIF